MATKALNFKLEESKILELKLISNIFQISMTDAINEALDSYFSEMKKDPLYRLTANVQDASAQEAAEILDSISNLSDENLSISTVKVLE